MGVKEKRDNPISPVILKVGVALAFSLGGIVYSLLKSKIIKTSKSKSSQGSSGMVSRVDSSKDDDRALQNSISELSSNGHRDGFLEPEFDQLVKEFDMVFEQSEHEDQENEIRSLHNKVKILEEREKNLEIQLFEYYGLKEQETAVMELQNRLKINNMETKLYNIKVESLQSQNRRLQAQVLDYDKVVEELEAAKAKIKLLRKKLSLEAERNREQILNLKERVMKLQEQEIKDVEIDPDVEMQVKRMKEELEEMKSWNQSLKQENSELAQKLQQVQIPDNEEVESLKKERELLRQQNDDLRKEIEQLQADRCTDIEQLVYLRWINACLRYEMRNFQPGPGETIARDLSKTLSPKSEEKAKVLILEYANKEGFLDFDPDQWSTSHSSCFTDSGEQDDLPFDNSSANKPSKTKVLAKLMKLWRGKDSHNHIQTGTSPERYSSTCHSCVTADDPMKTTKASSRSSSRPSSFDLQGSSCSRRTSDESSLSIFRRIDSITEGNDQSSPRTQPHQDAQNAARVELVKYAEALKNSRGRSSSYRRSASFGSF